MEHKTITSIDPSTPQTFSYGELPLRTVLIEKKPWFVLADAGKALDIKNTADFLKSKYCNEKGVENSYPLETPGGVQRLTLINERNLYALVGRSTKPGAMAFMDWVYGEVLPEIRETGRYSGSPLGIENDPIIALGMSVVEIRRAQLDVEKRVSLLEKQRDAAAEAMMALPEASVEARRQTVREQCNEGIAQLHHLTGWNYDVCWQKAYFRYNQCLHVNATKRARNAGMKRLDWVEACGKIEVLYAIIADMIKSVKTSL
ncbi:MAG: Bro-N domain-containing protein [Fimbriimonas sp.]